MRQSCRDSKSTNIFPATWHPPLRKRTKQFLTETRGSEASPRAPQFPHQTGAKHRSEQAQPLLHPKGPPSRPSRGLDPPITPPRKAPSIHPTSQGDRTQRSCLMSRLVQYPRLPARQKAATRTCIDRRVGRRQSIRDRGDLPASWAPSLPNTWNGDGGITAAPFPIPSRRPLHKYSLPSRVGPGPERQASSLATLR